MNFAKRYHDGAAVVFILTTKQKIVIEHNIRYKQMLTRRHRCSFISKEIEKINFVDYTKCYVAFTMNFTVIVITPTCQF